MTASELRCSHSPLSHEAHITPQVLDRTTVYLRWYWYSGVVWYHPRCRYHGLGYSIKYTTHHFLRQIFFPRSIETEYNLKQASHHKGSSFNLRSRAHQPHSTLSPTSPHSVKSYPSEIHIGHDGMSDEPDSTFKNPWDAEPYTFTAAPPVTFAPNRRLDSGAMVEGGVKTSSGRDAATRDPEAGGVHPFVHNYTSPIGACRFFFPPLLRFACLSF